MKRSPTTAYAFYRRSYDPSAAIRPLNPMPSRPLQPKRYDANKGNCTMTIRFVTADAREWLP